MEQQQKLRADLEYVARKHGVSLKHVGVVEYRTGKKLGEFQQVDPSLEDVSIFEAVAEAMGVEPGRWGPNEPFAVVPMGMLLALRNTLSANGLNMSRLRVQERDPRPESATVWLETTGLRP